jgi:hypothetical protein
MTQTLEIKGKYLSVAIKSDYTKNFKEFELVYLATQILKAYSIGNLKDLLTKLEVE